MLTQLSGELGYPVETEEMKHRLERLCADAQHGVFVAENDSPIGWIHVSMMETLESEMFGEIRGLVVSESFRKLGIGKQLVDAAEDWVNKKGIDRIRVRTNIVRKETRDFYRNLGYASTKTQEIFDKHLKSGTSPGTACESQSFPWIEPNLDQLGLTYDRGTLASAGVRLIPVFPISMDIMLSHSFMKISQTELRMSLGILLRPH